MEVQGEPFNMADLVEQMRLIREDQLNTKVELARLAALAAINPNRRAEEVPQEGHFTDVSDEEDDARQQPLVPPPIAPNLQRRADMIRPKVQDRMICGALGRI